MNIYKCDLVEPADCSKCVKIGIMNVCKNMSGMDIIINVDRTEIREKSSYQGNYCAFASFVGIVVEP